MKQYLYLIIDFACISIPFIASFYPPHPFYKKWKPFFLANAAVALFFLVWDVVFTHWGVWGFNPTYLVKWYLFNLPIEEILFFICIPYASVFTYFALTYLVPNNPIRPFQFHITSILGICLLAIGLMYYSRAYTAVTFVLCGSYLLAHRYRKSDLSAFYFSFLFVLVFFFISNGILTGSFIEDEVVWYNNSENLGIRMWTIPVEDTFYGMLLILMNIDLMHYIERRWLKTGKKW